MIDCEENFGKGGRGENCVEDGHIEGRPRRWVEVVTRFKFRSPAERGLIPNYVLSQMNHRPDGLPQDQMPVAGRTDAGVDGRRSGGRRRHRCARDLGDRLWPGPSPCV